MNLKILSVILLFFVNIAFPCTTAIISGKSTKDGRPLLLKHRDSDFFQNRIVYISSETLNYLGLVNSQDKDNKEVWAGCNSKGFAIMNSASYNLKPSTDKTETADMEGVLMKLALEKCETIDDFENLLKTLPKPLGVEANFGVIDAKGGAAYFETNNFTYKKFDVNDPVTAPNGYLIRTNYSFSGEKDQGYGYIRYKTAEELIETAKKSNTLTPTFLFQEVSRCIKNSLTKIELNNKNDLNSSFANFEDFIPRFSSTASVVIQGVKADENPNMITMWTIVGFPFTSVAIPLVMGAGEYLPNILISNSNNNSTLCEKSLLLKKKCFPKLKDHERKYIKIDEVINENKSGIFQKLITLENEIIAEYKNLRMDVLDTKKLNKFYRWVDGFVINKYKELFGI